MGHEEAEVVRGVDEHQILIRFPIDPVKRRMGVIGACVGEERLHLGAEASDCSADVGVGIIGKEGRQAVNSADFAVSQFRFLVRLLLVHGSLSAYRYPC